MDQKTTNLLKALAILAVIAIHTAAAQTLFFHQHNLSAPDYFLTLDLLVRFSVPLFVALSGFGLAKKYVTFSFTNFINFKNLKDFYFRRVARLVPWYLFWGAIIYLYINFIGQGPTTYGQTPIWKLFVFGRIDYHLYFVPMIFTLYLIFPLLWLAVRKFPKLTLLLAFLWQIFFYSLVSSKTEHGFVSSGWSDQEQYIQIASWLFYFILGIFLSNKEEVLRDKKWLPPVAITLTIGGFFYLYRHTLGLRSIDIDPIVFTRFTQIPVLVYATGFILTGLLIIPRLLSYLPAEISVKAGFPTLLLSSLVFLGELSYLLYLNHTLALRLLTKPPFNLESLPFWILLVVTLVLSCLMAAATQKLFVHLERLIKATVLPKS